MAEIPALTVVKLRKMSGQGMMDCKKALEEAEGDVEKAMGLLRKKGLATLAKRTERETTEGAVVSKAGPGRKEVAMASLCCETDFAANSDAFISAAESLADCTLVCPAEQGVGNLLETIVNGKKYNDILTEAVSKTGEKMQVEDYIRYKLDGPGVIGVYIHFNKKVGTMVHIATGSDGEAAAMQQTAVDIAMHITAAKPMALDKDGVNPEVIEKEKEIAAAQIKNKPADIVAKIVEGKMKKFFADNCLLEQQFVKDDSKTIRQFLSEAAKQAGGTANIKRFARFEVG